MATTRKSINTRDKNPNTNTQIKSLKIAAINVNSIRTHHRRFELSQFIEKHKLDIALVSETKLHPTHNIKMKDHEIIRTDRQGQNSTGGGTAIIIKKNIEYNIINYPNSLKNEILEYTIINIPTHSKKENLYIISIYASHKNTTKTIFINEITELFCKLKLNNPNNKYIIAGDLNARNEEYGDACNNQRGKYLAQWEKTYTHIYRLNIISTEEPTFTPAQTYLHLCLIDNNIEITNLNNNKLITLEYDSDHRAIQLQINIDTYMIQTKHTIGKPLFKKTKWNEFTKYLDDEHKIRPPIDKNMNKNEVDEFISNLTNTINASIKKIVPLATQYDNTHCYVNHKIIKLHKIKSQLITRMNKIKKINNRQTISIITEIKIKIKNIREAIRQEFATAMEKHWERIYKKINHKDPDNFFPIINNIFKQKQHNKIPDIQIERTKVNLLDRARIDPRTLPLVGDTYHVTDQTEKLNVLGAYLESINTPRHLNTNTRLREIIDDQIKKLKEEITQDTINNITVTQFTKENKACAPNAEKNIPKNYFCTYPEVTEILKKLPNKTSTGPDNIPNIVLKHLPRRIIWDLTTIFNNALNMNYFPDAWKTAKVLPFMKKNKNPVDPASYEIFKKKKKKASAFGC